MIIRLWFEVEGEDSTRVAEREFEWEEGMKNVVVIGNPSDPRDTLELKLCDELEDEEGDGIKAWIVIEQEGRLPSFEDILKYGFVERPYNNSATGNEDILE